jgi:predicted ATPase
MPLHLNSVTLHPEAYPTREHYPFNLDVLQQTRRLTFDSPVTLLVGENGTGKSTFLEALTTACGIYIWRPPEGRRVERNPYEETDHYRVYRSFLSDRRQWLGES